MVIASDVKGPPKTWPCHRQVGLSFKLLAAVWPE